MVLVHQRAVLYYHLISNIMCYNIIFLFKLIGIIGLTGADYWVDRLSLIDLEASKAVGANVTLSAKEELVNKILMKFKLQELDHGFEHPENYLPGKHFFESKNDIEKSKVFEFIKSVPKGASLHSHSTALTSVDFLFNLTFRENLYGCVHNNRLALHFFHNNSNNFCNWTLVSTLRRENSSFDDFLKSQFTLIVDNPHQAYRSINDVWKKFTDTFWTIGPLIRYVEVFKDYFYQALQELNDDNVMYLEFRSALPPLYDLNGNLYGPVEVVEMYIDILNKFKREHPDFYGAKLIYAAKRHATNTTIVKYIQTALEIQETFPDFLAGFDLVGQEDLDQPLGEEYFGEVLVQEQLGEPLISFISHLLKLSKKMKFFFHAGETNWNGVSTDFNLVDAVLLNTSRIGHGYALVKHREILNIVKSRGIAIEVCPISNQVLKLVDDMRNHPATILINEGFNVVICSDDPTFWGAKGLSYDWYMAFMGMASRQSDLRLLKQLAINSILYSAMGSREKEDAIAKWNEKWEEFLDYALDNMSDI